MPGAFLPLLIAVVGALLVGPLLDTGPRAVIDQALFSAVLIAAVVSVRRQRGQLIAAAAGALVAVGLGWAALVTGDDTIVLAWFLLTVLFLGFVIVSLLGVVFRTHVASPALPKAESRIALPRAVRSSLMCVPPRGRSSVSCPA